MPQQTIFPPVHVSRRLYIEQVRREWANKDKIARYLADNLDTLSREFPLMARQEIYRSLAAFGVAVAEAKTPEECVDLWVELIKKHACPEPGWDAACVAVD